MEEQQEKTIIEMYNKRRPMSWISKAVGIPDKTIKKWLKENNYWTGHKYLLSYYDEFFFDKIDTEEKAYWLGFIFADGYLTSNTNEVGIELAEKDFEHLVKFKKALQAEREVKLYYKNSTFGPQVNARFSISSKHMHSILLGYYRSVKKTFEGFFPLEAVPNELKRHFIRGFFDGNGSISLTRQEEGHLLDFSISFNGKKETLQKIQNISGFSWNWSQRFPERNTDNYQISIGKVQDSIAFLNYMYSDTVIFLDRKYERYLQIKQNREEYKAKARV